MNTENYYTVEICKASNSNVYTDDFENFHLSIFGDEQCVIQKVDDHFIIMELDMYNEECGEYPVNEKMDLRAAYYKAWAVYG